MLLFLVTSGGDAMVNVFSIEFSIDAELESQLQGRSNHYNHYINGITTHYAIYINVIMALWMLFLILALCVGLNPIIRSQNVEITKRQMELVKNVTRVLDAAIKGNSATTKINNKMK